MFSNELNIRKQKLFFRRSFIVLVVHRSRHINKTCTKKNLRRSKETQPLSDNKFNMRSFSGQFKTNVSITRPINHNQLSKTLKQQQTLQTFQSLSSYTISNSLLLSPPLASYFFTVTNVPQNKNTYFKLCQTPAKYQQQEVTMMT